MSLHVRITQDRLVHALQQVLKAVSANSPIPILGGVHLRADRDGLTLTGSSAGMSIEARIAHDRAVLTVQETGSIVVPGRYLYEIVRKLDGGDVELAMDDNAPLLLAVMAGAARIRLCGMDAAEYPSANLSQPVHRVRVNCALLKSAIRQVAMAVATSEARPVLTGVCMEFKEGALHLTATDGIRLAARSIRAVNLDGMAAPMSAVVPGNNLMHIASLLSDSSDEVALEIGSSHIRCNILNVHVQSALIDGAFPPMHNVIPQLYRTELIVETAGLLHALERTSVLAEDNVIRLAAASDQLVMASRTAALGDVLDGFARYADFGHLSITCNY